MRALCFCFVPFGLDALAFPVPTLPLSHPRPWWFSFPFNGICTKKNQYLSNGSWNHFNICSELQISRLYYLPAPVVHRYFCRAPDLRSNPTLTTSWILCFRWVLSYPCEQKWKGKRTHTFNIQWTILLLLLQNFMHLEIQFYVRIERCSFSFFIFAWATNCLSSMFGSIIFHIHFDSHVFWR